MPSESNHESERGVRFQRKAAVRLTAVSIVLAVGLILVPTIAARLAQDEAQTRAAGHFPSIGIFVPGTSLGGVQLGNTIASVRARWGSGFKVCTLVACTARGRTTWFYTYRQGEPLGAAVTFDHTGHVASVWTLGAPDGWYANTHPRLVMHTDPGVITSLYGQANYVDCVFGFSAEILKEGNSVTVFYVNGEAIYGFGLMRPSEPVCN